MRRNNIDTRRFRSARFRSAARPITFRSVIDSVVDELGDDVNKRQLVQWANDYLGSLSMTTLGQLFLDLLKTEPAHMQEFVWQAQKQIKSYLVDQIAFYYGLR